MEAMTTLQRVLMSVYLIITCFIIHLLGCILSRLVIPNETNYETRKCRLIYVLRIDTGG